MRAAFNVSLLVLTSSLTLQSVAARELPADAYLKAQLQIGQSFTNVFSRTIAFRAPGWDDLVSRISGTGVYTVTEVAGDRFLFDGKFLYDGRPESKGKTESRDHGRTTCWEGQCSTATDASGLLYNAALWGEPASRLHQGSSWTVDLKEPWELGPAGRQKVLVVFVDPVEHVITLKREGTGTGYFASDKKQVKLTRDGKAYTMEITPGPSHWAGYTTFRAGIVISDELLVERPVTFTNSELGAIDGTERQYILLNLAPNGEV